MSSIPWHISSIGPIKIGNFAPNPEKLFLRTSYFRHYWAPSIEIAPEVKSAEQLRKRLAKFPRLRKKMRIRKPLGQWNSLRQFSIAGTTPIYQGGISNLNPYPTLELCEYRGKVTISDSLYDEKPEMRVTEFRTLATNGQVPLEFIRDCGFKTLFNRSKTPEIKAAWHAIEIQDGFWLLTRSQNIKAVRDGIINLYEGTFVIDEVTGGEINVFNNVSLTIRKLSGIPRIDLFNGSRLQAYINTENIEYPIIVAHDYSQLFGVMEMGKIAIHGKPDLSQFILKNGHIQIKPYARPFIRYGSSHLILKGGLITLERPLKSNNLIRNLREIDCDHKTIISIED